MLKKDTSTNLEYPQTGISMKTPQWDEDWHMDDNWTKMTTGRNTAGRYRKENARPFQELDTIKFVNR